MFLVKKHRREILVLNVIPLIDICSMIIIFLIMGTIFGESSIDIPPEVFVPKSNIKDSAENAPRVVILNKQVDAHFLNKKIDLEHFHAGDNVAENHLNEVKKYVSEIPKEVKLSGALLNVVADKNTPYKNIFAVVKLYRQAGFDSVLFVTLGEQ